MTALLPSRRIGGATLQDTLHPPQPPPSGRLRILKQAFWGLCGLERPYPHLTASFREGHALKRNLPRVFLISAFAR